MPFSLVDECSRILHCSSRHLRDKLYHPQFRAQVLEALQGRIVKTLYLDKLQFEKTFSFDGLTHRGADQTMAYGRLSRTFNCTIAQHYYSRHRIRLQFPYLPCAVEVIPNGEDRFYPLELLKLDEPEVNELTNYLGNMFKERSISKEPSKYHGVMHDEIPIFTRCEQHEGWEECTPTEESPIIEMSCNYCGQDHDGPIYFDDLDDELTRFPTPKYEDMDDDDTDNEMTTFEMLHGLQESEESD